MGRHSHSSAYTIPDEDYDTDSSNIRGVKKS